MTAKIIRVCLANSIFCGQMPPNNISWDKKDCTLCKTTSFWEAVTQPFLFFFSRRGFHRDPRTIIQYKDLDAPDDADAF